MDDRRERVDRLAVEQNVDPDQVGRPIVAWLIVERGVALGPGLELVEEVEHDLGEGQPVVQLGPFGRQIGQVAHLTSPLLDQVHHRPDVVARCDDHHLDIRLLHRVELARRRQVVRAAHLKLGAVGPACAVRHRRGRRDQIEVIFALKALLDDLHVEQPEEAASEPEAERTAGLWLEDQRGVIEPELVKRFAQPLEIVALRRE